MQYGFSANISTKFSYSGIVAAPLSCFPFLFLSLASLNASFVAKMNKKISSAFCFRKSSVVLYRQNMPWSVPSF